MVIRALDCQKHEVDLTNESYCFNYNIFIKHWCQSIWQSWSRSLYHPIKQEGPKHAYLLLSNQYVLNFLYTWASHDFTNFFTLGCNLYGWSNPIRTQPNVWTSWTNIFNIRIGFGLSLFLIRIQFKLSWVKVQTTKV